MFGAFYICAYAASLIPMLVLLYLVRHRRDESPGIIWFKRTLQFFAISVFYGFCGALTAKEIEGWEWVIMRLVTLSGAIYCFCRYAHCLTGSAPVKHFRLYLTVFLIVSLLLPFMNLAVHIARGSITESEILWSTVTLIDFACLFFMALPGALQALRSALKAAPPVRRRLLCTALFPLCMPLSMVLLPLEAAIPAIPYLYALMLCGLYLSMR